ncbi:MAG: hypothetical protein ACI4KG_05805 [Oscillospiraceae bacterium]
MTAINSVSCNMKKSGVLLFIPVTQNTLDLEFIVRNCVFRLAEEYPETTVILINFSSDIENIRIFEKLMICSCKYIIINSEECSENICKIIDNMI